MSYLILVRHGESLWNEKGLWTGWTDIELSEKGREEARKAGEEIKDLPIDEVYVSSLSRAKQTWEEIAKVIGKQNLPTIENAALNERNYGDYTGKNKWELKDQLGDEKFQQIRRDWDTPIPNGESLKDVSERVLPYFQEEILPKLKQGKNILISAHGNSLRSLVKYLDQISDDDISHLEIKTGEVYVYKINSDGSIEGKDVFK
jgi:2,3-bisphosphoglycerate-dependent phosphoglycerate mutase